MYGGRYKSGIKKPRPVSYYRASAFRRMLIGGTLAFLFCAVFLAINGINDKVFKADVAVVLGNQVYRSGKLSPRLAGRVDRAVKLYKEGWCKKIIVSGGTGKNGVNEAEAMRKYVLGKGVPTQDIVVDPNGVNTRATAVFTAGYLRSNNMVSAIAVSQFYHLPRTRLAFKAEGVPLIGTAHADYFESRDFFSLAREVPAYFFYWSGLK